MRSTKAAEQFQSDVQSGDEWFASGSATLKMYFIYGKLTVKLKFPNGKKKEFKATIWGVGLGGGTSVGGGPWGNNYVPANGKMDYEIAGASYTAGELQMFFIKDKKVVGSFVGPAIGSSAVIGGGHGKWRDD